MPKWPRIRACPFIWGRGGQGQKPLLYTRKSVSSKCPALFSVIWSKLLDACSLLHDVKVFYRPLATLYFLISAARRRSESTPSRYGPRDGFCCALGRSPARFAVAVCDLDTPA